MARAHYANRELERRKQDAIITRISAAYLRPIAREIGQRTVAAANAFERDGEAAVYGALAGPKEKLEEIMTPMYTTTLDVFHDRFLQMKGLKSMEIKFTPQDVWAFVVRNFLFGIARDTLTDIVSTTHNQIFQAISKGMVEGLGVSAIAEDLRAISPSLSTLRANVISRTETHGAANFAGIETARQGGSLLQKEWIAAGDERTREEHGEADGDVVPLDGKFSVMGEQLDYPGDVNGSAGNIINCRCALGYVMP